MKPRIFLEQPHIEYPVSAAAPLSLRSFKIDYSQLLGCGAYGVVYPLVLRPAHEKGFLSTWFPYLYDTVYPANSLEATGYCVKISKTFFEIVAQQSLLNSSTVAALTMVANNFLERGSEYYSQKLRFEYGVSNIIAYPTEGWYSQIKTRVYGKTFEEYLKDGSFLKPTNYKMREAFIYFLWAVVSVPLKFSDFHSRNIMYDEKNKQWEIIDGSNETMRKCHTLDSRRKRAILLASKLLAGFSSLAHSESVDCVRILSNLALQNVMYTPRWDEAVLYNAKQANTSRDCLFLLNIQKKDRVPPEIYNVRRPRSRSLNR